MPWHAEKHTFVSMFRQVFDKKKLERTRSRDPRRKGQTPTNGIPTNPLTHHDFSTNNTTFSRHRPCWSIGYASREVAQAQVLNPARDRAKFAQLVHHIRLSEFTLTLPYINSMPAAGTMGASVGSSAKALSMSELILQNKATTCEFIPGRLYYAMLQGKPPSTTTSAAVHFFQVDDQLQYFPFYCDFGPNNIAQLLKFIDILDSKMTDAELQDSRLCLWTLSSAYDRKANCAFLMSAYMVFTNVKGWTNPVR